MPNTWTNSTQPVQPQFTFEGGHLVMFHQEQTGVPLVRDANVNDRDRTFDLLAQEKYLTSEYHTAMLEATDDALFQVFKQCHDNCHEIQRQLWVAAFKKGWYRVPVAEAQAVVAAFTKFQQSLQEFPFPVSQRLRNQGVSAGTTADWAQATVAESGSGNADQTLQQVVSQAIQQAQKGKVPTGYTTH